MDIEIQYIDPWSVTAVGMPIFSIVIAVRHIPHFVYDLLRDFDVHLIEILFVVMSMVMMAVLLSALCGLLAVVYNWAAARVGGIEIHTEPSS